jgi:tetratricopeptide (TPR) repeat protein
MKERQEQLEHNLVADGLVDFYKKIEPYSKLILAAVVAAVIGLIGLALYSGGQTAKRSDATLNLLMEEPEVSKNYPNTAAAAWSLLFQGNDSLAQGINNLYQDRDLAETMLAEAKERFKEARGATREKIVISRANYGLGLAAESLGEVDEASAAYQGVVDANESEQMVSVAKERMERLVDPQVKEFLAWFSEQDFAPADPSLPPELPGATTLPDLPDLELPDLSLGDGMKASDGPAEPVEGGLGLPDLEVQVEESVKSDADGSETVVDDAAVEVESGADAESDDDVLSDSKAGDGGSE